MFANYANKLFFLLLMLFLVGCSNNHFIIYKLNGEIEQDRLSNQRSNVGVELYFSKSDVKHKYEEINVIATNNFYYGQFFFDEIFMDILKDKAGSISADALIYEKHRKDYPHYNEEYLYFTAIRYKNVKGQSDIRLLENE